MTSCFSPPLHVGIPLLLGHYYPAGLSQKAVHTRLLILCRADVAGHDLFCAYHLCRGCHRRPFLPMRPAAYWLNDFFTVALAGRTDFPSPRLRNPEAQSRPANYAPTNSPFPNSRPNSPAAKSPRARSHGRPAPRTDHPGWTKKSTPSSATTRADTPGLKLMAGRTRNFPNGGPHRQGALLGVPHRGQGTCLAVKKPVRSNCGSKILGRFHYFTLRRHSH